MPTDAESWRQFRRYWYGHVASFAGDWFTSLALPLAALAVTRSPFFVGVVEFAELVATLLIGMRLGSIADRLPPRLAMAAADLVRAALLSTVALTFAGGVPHEVVLVLVALTLGSMRDLHDSAESVMMSAVVPPRLLVRANSRFQISEGFGHMVGSLLAGVAATLALSLAFGLDAASYLLAALAVWAMGRFQVDREAPSEMTPDAPWRSAVEAMRSEDRYWRVLATMCVANVATVCFMGQFVTFGTRELHLERWQLGLTIAAMGFGSFVAGLALDRVEALQPRMVLIASVVLGVVPVLAGATRSWTVTIVGFMFVGGVLSLGAALIGSMRHASFGDSVQGRIAMASRLGFTSGVMPGVLVAGWASAAMGPATMYVIFGGFGLAALLVGVRLGVHRLA